MLICYFPAMLVDSQLAEIKIRLGHLPHFPFFLDRNMVVMVPAGSIVYNRGL